jgi:SAM-dependent methyltransferase
VQADFDLNPEVSESRHTARCSDRETAFANIAINRTALISYAIPLDRPDTPRARGLPHAVEMDPALARYRFAHERLPREARVLDAACGLGAGTALLRGEAPARSVVGVDRGDLADLSAVANTAFDAVVSFDTIERLSDPVPFLRQARRVLVDEGLFIASVPAAPASAYDAHRLLELCGRFFSVDDLWLQTATDWRRCVPLGRNPEDPADWLLVIARKRRPVDRAKKSWLFITPGIPQLASMSAALTHWGIDASHVHVRGCSIWWDDEYHASMDQACRALGFQYGGNLPLVADIHVIGNPLDYCPDAASTPDEARDRVRATYPVLEGLADLNLAITARPGATSDYPLIAAIAPRELRLAADGIQNDVIIRDLSGMRGFGDGLLAGYPTDHEIVCPPWLATETAAIGRAHELNADACRDALARIGAIPCAQALACEIATRPTPFTAVVISQHFCRSGLTSSEAAWTFYLHQIRTLLRRTPGAVLFKAHPRDCRRKIANLVDALHDERDRVRVTVGAECYVPLEAFPGLATRTDTLDVWGTSSSALLGVNAWPGARPRCVDAAYLEPEIRRQAIQFSRRHGLPLTTLRFDDPLLDETDRQSLRRPFQLPPAAKRSAVLMAQVQEAHRRIHAEQQERQLLEALLTRNGHSVWIWGSGARGQHVLQRLRGLGVAPTAFLDSRPAPELAQVDDLQVLSIEAAHEARTANAIVIVASQYAHEIIQRIEADGDWRSRVYVWTNGAA